MKPPSLSSRTRPSQIRPLAARCRLLSLLCLLLATGPALADYQGGIGATLDGPMGRIHFSGTESLPMRLVPGSYCLQLYGEIYVTPPFIENPGGWWEHRGTDRASISKSITLPLGGNVAGIGTYCNVRARAEAGYEQDDGYGGGNGTLAGSAHAASSASGTCQFGGDWTGSANGNALSAGSASPGAICLLLCVAGEASLNFDSCRWGNFQGRGWGSVQACFTITNTIDTTLTGSATAGSSGTIGGGTISTPPGLPGLPTLPGSDVPASPNACDWRPAFVFTNVPSASWVALPVDGAAIRFEALSTTKFTAISNFPLGQIWVDVSGVSFGPFTNGQNCSFAPFPGGSVTNFSVRAASGVIPAAVPIQLAFAAPTGDFQARIVGPSEVQVELERLSLGLPPTGTPTNYVTNGETVRFTARVPGICVNRYQWCRNFAAIPGQTNQTLTISNLAPANLGAYSVVVWNELGAIESRALWLEPLRYTLTVNADGGSVGRVPNAAAYDPGTIVTLTATANPGLVFAGWGAPIFSTNNPVNLAIQSNTVVTALFGRPFGGTPWPVPGVVQAEDFDVGGEGVAYHDTEAANLGGSNYRPEGVDIGTVDGGGYKLAYSATGEWLNYTIRVQSNGLYRAVLRAASGFSGGVGRLDFSSGSQSNLITVPGTGGWQNWSNVVSAPFTLPAGVQAMRFTFAQASFDLDSITIIPVVTAPFGGVPWSVPGVVQAENFDEGGEGAAYHDTEPANLGGSNYRPEGVDLGPVDGGGFKLAYSATGEWLNYTIRVQSNGLYRAVLRAASGFSGGVGRLDFSSGSQSNLITVPGTGGWQNWSNVVSAPLTLPAGTQTMRFTYTQATFDLDSIGIIALPPPSGLQASFPSAGGAPQLNFAGEPGASYTILGTTNLAGPWAVLGPAVETTPGAFRFTDSEAENRAAKFYRVRRP